MNNVQRQARSFKEMNDNLSSEAIGKYRNGMNQARLYGTTISGFNEGATTAQKVVNLESATGRNVTFARNFSESEAARYTVRPMSGPVAAGSARMNLVVQLIDTIFNSEWNDPAF